MVEPNSSIAAAVEWASEKDDVEYQSTETPPDLTSDSSSIANLVSMQKDFQSTRQLELSEETGVRNVLEDDHDSLQLLKGDSLMNYESQKLQHEEINQHLEQIDALQAKLNYLVQEMATEARQTANTAEHGSMEQQIALKDEKIALLLKEGTNLSQNELRLRTVVKKISAKALEDDKTIIQLKRHATEAEKLSKSLKDKMSALEEVGKENVRQKVASEALEKDFQELKAKADIKSNHIMELQELLSQCRSAGSVKEAQKWQQLVEAERKTLADVQEELSEAKIEKELVEDRSRAQVRDLQAKLNREIEAGKAMELDLKGELQVRRDVSWYGQH